MATFTKNTIQILKNRYLLKGNEGKIRREGRVKNIVEGPR